LLLRRSRTNDEKLGNTGECQRLRTFEEKLSTTGERKWWPWAYEVLVVQWTALLATAQSGSSSSSGSRGSHGRGVAKGRYRGKTEGETNGA
ncbi:unnamed protein product, partial [Choristocarpus tenellus]